MALLDHLSCGCLTGVECTIQIYAYGSVEKVLLEPVKVHTLTLSPFEALSLSSVWRGSLQELGRLEDACVGHKYVQFAPSLDGFLY
jgi:hypothetical protein